jgi:hypothetical protein
MGKFLEERASGGSVHQVVGHGIMFRYFRRSGPQHPLDLILPSIILCFGFTAG